MYAQITFDPGCSLAQSWFRLGLPYTFSCLFLKDFKEKESKLMAYIYDVYQPSHL